jgi:type I restriction enzyme M protein
MDKVVATWQGRQDVPKYAHRATLVEIRTNDFNLNIPLYVDTFEEEEPVDLNAVQAEIERVEKELASTRSQLAEAIRELGL